MEALLHYVWKHKLYPLEGLVTQEGLGVEVIDPGLHNKDAGPDFFNAKLKIGDTRRQGVQPLWLLSRPELRVAAVQ